MFSSEWCVQLWVMANIAENMKDGMKIFIHNHSSKLKLLQYLSLYLSIITTSHNILSIWRVGDTSHAAEVALLFQLKRLTLPFPDTQRTCCRTAQSYPVGRLVYGQRCYCVHISNSTQQTHTYVFNNRHAMRSSTCFHH